LSPAKQTEPQMREIKLLGRGGQGVVVASEILSRSCFVEGLYPQCYALFGGERRGAPVSAFARVDDQKIYLKCDIERPNQLIVFDVGLLDIDRLADEVAPGGTILLNSDLKQKPAGLSGYTLGTIDASGIALQKNLGALVNIPLLGAYVRLTRIVALETLVQVIRDKIPSAVEQNVAAAEEAYDTLDLLQ